VAALFRTFATLEGTLALLAPGFDLVGAARDTARSRLTSSFTPQRLRRSAEEEALALLPILGRLLRRLDRVADAVEHGRLNVNVRVFADSRDRRWITGLVHQTLLTVIGATAGVMAVLLLDTQGGPRLTDSIRLFPVFGYALLVVSVVLVLRVLVAVFRQEQR
jgi:ubiquinone biosynthesis protein